VAWRPDAIELWRFDVAEHGLAAGGEDAAMKGDAVRAFSAAATALERRLPFSLLAVTRLRQRQLRARLAGVVSTAPSATALGVLDGPSFGLSFALAVASQVLGQPVHEDVIASACIDDDGRLRPVDGIDEKLRGVRELAPGLRRFLVAADQFSQDSLKAMNHRLAPLVVEPCRDLLHAVEIAIGDPFTSLGADEVAVLVPDLFTLALRERASTVSWVSARAAARSLLSRTHDDDQQQRLRFVDMIAGRHLGHEPPEAWPDLAFVDHQRRPLRVQLLSQLVQEHHDLGWPVASWLEPRVAGLLARNPDGTLDLGDAAPAELMLAGAWGRVLALDGRLVEALALQRAALEAFWDAADLVEVSHPLCEALRVAALLGDHAGFESLVERGRAFSRLRPQAAASGFLDLAIGRGLIQLGRSAEGASHLCALSERAGPVVPHVLVSAIRWRVRAGELDRASARRTLEAFDAATRGWVDTLMALDAAPDEAAAGGALAALSASTDFKAIVVRLHRAYPSPRDIASHFPY